MFVTYIFLPFLGAATEKDRNGYENDVKLWHGEGYSKYIWQESLGQNKSICKLMKI